MADGMVSIDDLSGLSLPFPDSAISWRVGSTNIDKKTGQPRNGKPAAGIALAYIDARDVMNRLDAVCGPANWSDTHVETEKGRIICTLSIRIGGEWIAKSDGAGDSDVESEKGAISDALKRAAVKWGIGRYLYEMDSPWVELEAHGNSWVMKAGERKKLDGIHHNYVRNHFKNAGSSDAGQREQPKTQQATGAGDATPAPAPVNPPAQRPPAQTVQTMSKKDSRTDFQAMIEEIRATQNLAELQAWGKANIARVGLQNEGFQADIRKEYGVTLAGFKYSENAARRANEDFDRENAA